MRGAPDPPRHRRPQAAPTWQQWAGQVIGVLYEAAVAAAHADGHDHLDLHHAGGHSHATCSGRGVSVSGRHLHCAAIWCGTSSVRQWSLTCAMVRARSTVQAAGRTGDEEALWPSGRRPATDLGPQDLPGRRVARCTVSRRRRVVVRAVGRCPARWPRGRDEHRILARDRTRSVGCHRRSPGAVRWPDDIAA